MSYREELDKVRLTEAGKAALTQALCRHMAERGRSGGPGGWCGPGWRRR